MLQDDDRGDGCGTLRNPGGDGVECGTLVPGRGGTLLPDQQPDLGTMVINSDSDEQTMKRENSLSLVINLHMVYSVAQFNAIVNCAMIIINEEMVCISLVGIQTMNPFCYLPGSIP